MKTSILIVILALSSTITYGQLKVLSNGKVGMGTSVPYTQLHLDNSNGPQITLSAPSGGGGNTGIVLRPYQTSAQWSNPAQAMISATDNNWSADIRFWTKIPGALGNNLQERMTILNSGNVGVGDATPSELFTVGNGDLFRVNSSGKVMTISGTASSPAYSFTGTTNTGIFSSGSGFINISTNGTEKMRVNSSGNFAIGSTTIDDNYRLKLLAGTINCIYSETTYNIDEIHYNVRLKVNHSYTRGLAVTRNNTTDTIWLSGSGEGRARTWTTSSDIRYKDNIVDVNDANSKIMSLRPVYFSYRQPTADVNDSIGSNENITPTYNYGLIAQEVNSIIPEAVHADNLGFMAIDYAPLVSLLIEAYKEQNQRLQELETSLNECRTSYETKDLSTTYNNTDISEGINSKTTLHQNQPNPFNSETLIKCYIAEKNANAIIYIFDMQGTLKKSISNLSTGSNEVKINAGNLKPGMYLYSLVVNGKEVDTKKMIITE